MGIMVTESDGSTWEAPFTATGVENLECAQCSAEDVRVRDNIDYYEGQEVDAYCGACHTRLIVTAKIEVVFGDVRKAE